MWEFPGGKIETGESPENALSREIREELGCEVRVGDEVITTTHEYGNIRVMLTTFDCALVDGEPIAIEHAQLRWVSPHDLHSLEWAPADLPSVRAISETTPEPPLSGEVAWLADNTDADGVHHEPSPDAAPLNFWEERYGGSDRVWSGEPNRVLVDVVSDLPPGRALDLGCGEGADVIWLAQRGWQATGIDLSPTAISRARAAASGLALTPEQASFEATDLSRWESADRYDLVTASFLHSPVELSRTEILASAADRVAPGGHLLITGHAAPPPWSRHHEADERHQGPPPRRDDLLTAQEQVADLALDTAEWMPLIVETRSRDAVGPDGRDAVLEDAVVLMRRGDAG